MVNNIFCKIKNKYCCCIFTSSVVYQIYPLKKKCNTFIWITLGVKSRVNIRWKLSKWLVFRSSFFVSSTLEISFIFFIHHIFLLLIILKPMLNQGLSNTPEWSECSTLKHCRSGAWQSYWPTNRLFTILLEWFALVQKKIFEAKNNCISL